MTDQEKNEPWWYEWGKDFCCEVCGRWFRQYHLNRNDSTRGYDCPKCGGLAPPADNKGPLLFRDEMGAKARTIC
ncbi:hypothetical protein LCGC14_1137640 [marine sediment metagenome]|uniref:Uncharacterized protein n=1 Tax=marine sediment metagenome TaxID=412755 RepID=A0A0F9Q4Z5_9ZZZZ